MSRRVGTNIIKMRYLVLFALLTVMLGSCSDAENEELRKELAQKQQRVEILEFDNKILSLVLDTLQSSDFRNSIISKDTNEELCRQCSFAGEEFMYDKINLSIDKFKNTFRYEFQISENENKLSEIKKRLDSLNKAKKESDEWIEKIETLGGILPKN